MKSPEEIADEIIETANDATRIVDGAHSCPAGHDDEDVDYFCCGCLRSMIAAAISAERSAGTSPNDRLVTPKLAVAARSAGTVPPAPAPGDLIARYTLEEWRSMEARSRELPDEPEDEEVEVCPPKPAPACARCGGAEVLPCPHLREECQRLRHEAKHEPCPECRGTP